MGPHYDIDEDTGELVYRDETTNWQTVRRELSESQLDRLVALIDSQEIEINNLLRAISQEH